jgi:hypothetical protein
MHHLTSRHDELLADSILRKFSRRFMFLFNDVIILCSKKDSAEQFDVQQVGTTCATFLSDLVLMAAFLVQVLWATDLRIKHLSVFALESLARGGAASASATSNSTHSPAMTAAAMRPTCQTVCLFTALTFSV